MAIEDDKDKVNVATAVECGEESDHDGEVHVQEDRITGGETKKKKKKKHHKKKKATPVQSDPPRIGLSKFFQDGHYPVGEIQEYKNDNSYRITSSENRALEADQLADPAQTYESIRRAAEVHRLVRQHARKHIKPGMSLTEAVENIEDGVRALVEESAENPFESGIGFPTGINRNEIAAHYSPNAGDSVVLQRGDVVKIDIGVHVKGRICDSAFTLAFDDTYKELMDAVQDATNSGIREAGIDVRLGDIGEAIQETMESYEVHIGSKVLPVKVIENLTGHTIHPYTIHGIKSVPLYQNGDTTRMEEGDYFAIETFGSTGRGYVIERGECSHYAKIAEVPKVPIRLETAKSLWRTINKQFGTLPFCRRYLDRVGEKNYLFALNTLVRDGFVQSYPPLCDQVGSMTAQFEHTILLRPTCKEVVSRGDDY